ncbi:MAG: glycoside hydrolase [Rhodanobacter sp.]|jgi:hypothetical protein|nr:glycoside hydrolase [Rhodanobacter sp.]
MPEIRFRTLYAISLAIALGLLLAQRGSAQTMPEMSTMHRMAAPPCESAQPLGCVDRATAAFAPDGTLLLTWTQDQKVYFARSKDVGQSWTLPMWIGDTGAGFDGGGDARPQVVADTAGHVLIAYDTFKDQRWNAQIWLAASADGGAHFDAARVFEPESVSQRLPLLDAVPSGKILMAWQDKRLSGPQKLPGASIAYAWSADGGRTFSASAIAASTSCECCRIGATNTVDGWPILVFRTIFPGKVRDHVVLRFLPSGLPDKPRRVAVDDWITDSCPHQGPSMAVSTKGTIHVAWYTQGKARQGVFYARSNNAGRGFDDPQRLGNPDDVTSRPFVFAHGEQVWRVWKTFDGQASQVLMQRSRNDGHDWSVPAVIASAVGRSDHPMLIGYRDRVFLSWLSSEHGYQLTELENPR